MVVRGVVLSLLATGCYAEITAGAAKSTGGVRGLGWELSASLGVSLGGTKKIPVRVGAGVDGSMAGRGAQDGHLGTKALGFQGRLEAGSPTVKGAVAYTRSFKDSLAFNFDGEDRLYMGHSSIHRVYVGVQREWDWNGQVQVAYGLGPTYVYMPNDFVGDTAAFGIQFRASHYFFPTANFRPSGSMLDTYSGPTPIEQGPPSPRLRCRDSKTGREWDC